MTSLRNCSLHFPASVHSHAKCVAFIELFYKNHQMYALLLLSWSTCMPQVLTELHRVSNAHIPESLPVNEPTSLTLTSSSSECLIARIPNPACPMLATSMFDFQRRSFFKTIRTTFKENRGSYIISFNTTFEENIELWY